MQDKKPRSRADGGRGSSALLSIQGWKAWTAIAGGTAMAIAITIAVALGLRPEPPDVRESTARTDAPAAPVKEESYVRNLEKSTEINPGERPFNSLESSRKDEPDQPT